MIMRNPVHRVQGSLVRSDGPVIKLDILVGEGTFVKAEVLALILEDLISGSGVVPYTLPKNIRVGKALYFIL